MRAAVTPRLKRTFEALGVPNYRRYFAGQVVSLSGNWMQTVAELWLVLSLTGSAVAVGITTALQFTPMLFVGALGGVIADRYDKRRLLMLTQALMALPALALFALAATGVLKPWMIFALVFARGAVNAFDNPARQSFLVELVGRDKLINAVGLNSALVQTARVLGPAGAGIVIATLSVQDCFLLNGLSFGAMLWALKRMEPAELNRSEPAPRKRGQLRSALRYVRSTPHLLIPLAMMALAGTLAYNFQVLLPLLARFSFHGGPGTYATLTSAMGAGAIVGALATGTRKRVPPAFLSGAALVFGGALAVAALAPTLDLELIALALTGMASVTFAASVNSALQLGAKPAMRGRVMSLYSVVFLGSTPIGGPLMSLIAGHAGPRTSMLVGAAAALAAGLLARIAYRRTAGGSGEAVAMPSPGGIAGEEPVVAEAAEADAPRRRARRPRGEHSRPRPRQPSPLG
ncbi:MAG: MFS transporter [Thermoleophilaceae bacterium]